MTFLSRLYKCVCQWCCDGVYTETSILLIPKLSICWQCCRSVIGISWWQYYIFIPFWHLCENVPWFVGYWICGLDLPIWLFYPWTASTLLGHLENVLCDIMYWSHYLKAHITRRSCVLKLKILLLSEIPIKNRYITFRYNLRIILP